MRLTPGWKAFAPAGIELGDRHQLPDNLRKEQDPEAANRLGNEPGKMVFGG
jgi:hypothetical protein